MRQLLWKPSAGERLLCHSSALEKAASGQGVVCAKMSKRQKSVLANAGYGLDFGCWERRHGKGGRSLFLTSM